MTGSPSGSSLSIPKPEVQVGQKMSTAQAELQACEAHLAAKEQELNAFRTNTIRSGLQARCKAMVECGWAWGEMGKEGIRALETLWRRWVCPTDTVRRAYILSILALCVLVASEDPWMIPCQHSWLYSHYCRFTNVCASCRESFDAPLHP